MAVLVAVHGEGPPRLHYLGIAVLAGLCGTVGLAALYRGLAVGDMSVVAPISATAAVVPVLVGVATGDRPSAGQGVGIAMALGGVVLVSLEPRAGGARGRAAGVGLAVVAALSFGVLLVALDAASEGDPLWSTLVMRSTSLTLFVVAALVVRPSFALAAADVGALAVIGLLDAGGNALFALASTRGLLTVVAVLAQLYPVVTVLLARFLLGERVSGSQRVGVAGALAGVALITAA